MGKTAKAQPIEIVVLFGKIGLDSSDLNNVQVADVMSEWLRKKGLDK